MNLQEQKLQEWIETLFEQKPTTYSEEDRQRFEEFLDLLNRGAIRASERDSSQSTGWRVNSWVKKGILLGFRIGTTVEMPGPTGSQQFFDKSTYPLKKFSLDDGVRIVPGGSSVRAGCYVGRGVTCMPPMYINVGAYVDDGTMVDSHALIGSCAQIGRNCHISASSQIGGVLEPVGALPVIIEDDVLVGGNCGVYEGAVVKRGAVLGSGTILNRSTPCLRSRSWNRALRGRWSTAHHSGRGRGCRRFPGNEIRPRERLGHFALHAGHCEIPGRRYGVESPLGGRASLSPAGPQSVGLLTRLWPNGGPTSLISKSAAASRTVTIVC